MNTPRESVTPILAAFLQSNNQPEQRIFLRTPVVHIGRGVTNPHDVAIAPEDVLVSREHARLVLETSHWILEDTSRNGTMVNGEWVKGKRVVLRAGDRIQIGKTFDFLFRELYPTDAWPTDEELTGGQNQSLMAAQEAPPSKTGIWISPSAAVWRDGSALPLSLSRTEYRLLKYLAKHPGDVCDYDSVIRAVWGSTREKDSLHELIYRIRRKIEPDPAMPRYLIIRSGIGVVFFPYGADTNTNGAPRA
jgi:hypothetical protein